jgi:hypothetical protein
MSQRGGNIMTLGQKGHILIRVGLGLVLILALLAGVGNTRSNSEEGVGLPKHYPDQFSGFGRIDRIASDEIVIDDLLYRLASSVTYHTPTRTNASRSWFRTGNLVGFVLNLEQEIILLCLIQ